MQISTSVHPLIEPVCQLLKSTSVTNLNATARGPWYVSGSVFSLFSGYKFSLILLSTFVYLHSFFFHNVFSPTMNNESTYRKFLCFLLSWLLRPNFFFSSHELFVNRFFVRFIFPSFTIVGFVLLLFFLNLCWRATLWKIF